VPVAPAPTAVAAAPAPAPASPAPAPVAISFRGSPEFTTSDGWRFKVRGRVNYDTSWVGNPNEQLAVKDLRLTTRFRRFRLGVEGEMPGGFAYKAEAEFSDAQVRAADVTLSYRASKTAPIEITIGHIEPLNGFEQITSSRYTSTIERGEYNEAFANVRRLGGYLTYISPGNVLRWSAGIFGDTVNADRTNDEMILSSRAVWAPKLGETQLHIGANLAYRTYQSNQLGTTFRARPFTNNTDSRFVDTGALALRSDLIVGSEFIAIRGPFHFIAEAQHLSANTIRPGEALAPGNIALGRRTSFDPGFWGAIAEVGWFFTGETRAYRDGLWARTRPRRPLGQGGIGALSLNLRYDHLDLSDQAADAVVAADFVDGGRQDGYIAALVWQPTDYVRFTLQYAHGVVTGGPLQAIANPLSLKPVSERSFGFDMAALRAAWDW
jgi:phosphate-selective porin OprO and OprP